MKSRSFLLIINFIVSLLLIIYGGFYSTYKVYEGSKTNHLKMPFYDWLKETEVITATTFGGIQRVSDGRLFTLHSYNLKIEEKLWKFCPT
ncbi:MAG: hypothetical protein SV062_03455 [Thermodesulfobacteriota bacterium]|nr:hypothetical protein [Thermodesulfobacteriota bacterium]